MSQELIDRNFGTKPLTLASDPKLGETLVAAGLISVDQLQLALHEQTRHGEMLGQILCRLGYLDETQLCRMLSVQCGMPMLLPEELAPDLQLLRYVSHARAESWQMLPLRLEQGILTMACADPYDLIRQNQARSVLAPNGLELDFVLVPATALRQAINASYGITENVGSPELTPLAEDISGWLHRLLQNAVIHEASDLHFALESQALQIRARIDGIMLPLKTMHRDFWPALLQRLKILTGVNIAETRRPQDGRFSESCDGVRIDCRVGFMPTIHGEAVALRLLDPRRARRSFRSMGFSSTAISRFKNWLERPDGLVLVTGPTGSGKSTTLNAMLHMLDHTSRTVMTLEDPVEYQFDGIRQTQIKEAQGLGFAEGIRTLLRHDPDVILIGEIRDAETAQQAMRAAMTGHLVLSTLHATNAAAAVPRLLDLGCTRALLAQHLRGVVAQRLVRTLCTCQRGHELTATPHDSDHASLNLRENSGCDACFGTGRRGRAVVAEILSMPDDAAALFGDGQIGYPDMWQHGLELVQSGLVAADDLAAMVPRTDEF
jgi:type IV pilus assembly protein PilB